MATTRLEPGVFISHFQQQRAMRRFRTVCIRFQMANTMTRKSCATDYRVLDKRAVQRVTPQTAFETQFFTAIKPLGFTRIFPAVVAFSFLEAYPQNWPRIKKINVAL
jgi:hypothetical protein